MEQTLRDARPRYISNANLHEWFAGQARASAASDWWPIRWFTNLHVKSLQQAGFHQNVAAEYRRFAEKGEFHDEEKALRDIDAFERCVTRTMQGGIYDANACQGIVSRLGWPF